MGLEDHHGQYHQHDHGKDLTQNLAASGEAGELGRGRVTGLRELDLIPERVNEIVLASHVHDLGKIGITNDILYTHNTHVTTGFIGVKYLLPVLTKFGRSDLAYELATQTTYPSWGYMVSRGATTLWELWQEKIGPAMNSHNHAMFGSLGAWFYQALSGINLGPDGAGYRHIRFQPQIVRDLDWASGSVETVRGTVSCSWSRTPGSVTVEATVPVNSDAKVILPKSEELSEITVQEGDRVIWEKGHAVPGASGVVAVSEGRREIAVDIGSGHYLFKIAGQ